jgi:hypothetical protein
MLLMRGEANPQSTLFSHVSLEPRVPRDHSVSAERRNEPGIQD